MRIIFFKLFLLITLLAISPWSAAIHSSESPTSLQAQLASLEAVSGGRIGLSAVNTANGKQFQYRATERFPLCSTSKFMVAAAILKRSMSDRQLLEQKIAYSNQDLITYSPITQKKLTQGMTVGDLCAASISYSDNTAANLLIKKLGGPSAVTAFARSIGDSMFRLDRLEPDLNSATPDDPRDTTTPEAMVTSLQRLVLGDELEVKEREHLVSWLKANTTGTYRIRAGLPKDWIVGDKTGSGSYGTTNDIGVIWPPKCSPIVVAVYFTQAKSDAQPNDKVIATATDLLIKEIVKTDSCIRNSISLK